MRPLLSLAILILLSLAARAEEPFEIKDGDRVLFLGDTLLEREGTYGYLETRMQEQFPDRHFTVRNLAFSADTPMGWSRASFDPAAKGFERLKEQIAMVRPTVVFLGYGMAASLQEMTDRSGDPTLNADPARYGAEAMSALRFKKELGQLMDAIVEIGAQPAAPAANTGNDRASLNGTAVRGTATPAELSAAVTTAEVAAASTKPNPRDAAGGRPQGKVRFVLLSPIRHEDLRATRPGLPDPKRHNELLAQYTKAIEELAQERGARLVDLFRLMSIDAPPSNPPGMPTVTDNGIHLNEYGAHFLEGYLCEALEWPMRGINEEEAAEPLRRFLRPAIIRKNALFFYQWRPANSTYLFGFRKHEQGQNAKEMPMFDPLIEQAEAEIDRLKRSSAPRADGVPSGADGTPAKPEVTPATANGTPAKPEVTPATADGTPAKPEVTPATADGTPAKPEVTPATADGTPARPEVTPATADGTPARAEVTPATPELTPSVTEGVNSKPAATTSVSPLKAPPLPKPDFTVEEGYQIDLWAENPLLYKPTQMNWDPAGRLWVASSALYPQIAPGGEATDSIVVIEDADHDGTAEKSHVFATGLLIPTGVQPMLIESKDGPPRYGCYVGQSTELLYFEDTDGDGKADTKRIILSGFGTEDTHHIVHTLKRGPDRRLYFNQSVYIHTHLETPWGVVRLNSGGVLAWDPRTEKVEVFDKGLWNTWGHQFDKWGQSFQTDGAGSTGITWSFPGATFAPFEGSRRTLQSISPGAYPKFAGLELIYSPHFPAEWQGNAVTCDFRAHRVVRFGITDLAEGEKPQAGYTTQEMPDLVRTSDVAFRPIDVKMGPDGAIYIADWSNPVINHGEVDFRDPRRDHTHGRIWRVTRKGAPLARWEPIPGKPNSALLDNLISPNLWAKEQSRTVLGKRLIEEIEKKKMAARASGLVTLGGTGTPDGLSEVEQWYKKDRNDDRLREAALLESAFATTGWARFPTLAASPDPRLQALVPRLMSGMRSRGQYRSSPATPTPTPEEQQRELNLYSLPKLVQSKHPRVRLEALRTLARLPGIQSMNLVLDTAIKVADDPFLDYAAWLSVNDLAPRWTNAVLAGQWPIEGHEAQLEYGLNAIDPALAGTMLAKLLADKKIVLTSGPWIELVGRAGGPDELAALYESLITSFAGDCCPGRQLTSPAATAISEEQGQRMVTALVEAARVRNAKPSGELSVAGLTPHAPKPLVPGLLQLAGLWKTPDAMEVLPAAANGPDTAQRVAAIDGLRALGGADAIKALGGLCDPAQPFGIRRTAVTALAALKFPVAEPFIPAILHDAPTEQESLATWRGLLAAQGGANALARQVTKGTWAKDLPKTNLTAGVRAAREGGKKSQTLLAALTPLAGLTAAPTAPADYQTLAEKTIKDGDPAAGEMLYRKATSGCVLCHAIGGAGGIVGPALTSIGASAPLDYIIESMLAPAAKVKEGYNAVTLKLKDGTEVTGIQARETAQEVILRNVAGQETAVPKANITGKSDVGSIMPAGLLEQYTDRDRLNLYAFLSQIGKPGPYDASKGSVARVWRLYVGNQPEKALQQDTAEMPALAYTNVDGRLTKDALTDALPMLGDPGDTIFVTAQFQVAAAGKVRFDFTGISKAFLDGQPLAVASEPNPSAELAPGTHTLAVKLDVKALPAVLRAEAPGANFLGN